MKKSFLLIVFFIVTKFLSAQYDSECYITTKKEITLAVENMVKESVDSVHIQDTMMINGVSRFIDTVVKVWNLDDDPYVKKFIGCRMPDFPFFTIEKEDLSLNKVTSDFTIISFSSVTYGDVCNARLHQYCRLKSLLQDSLTVLNIFEEKDSEVKEYSGNFQPNVEFIANADVLVYNYTFNGGTVIYVLDKYKNIIYVKSGFHYNNTPDEIYGELLEIIRSTDCSD